MPMPGMLPAVVFPVHDKSGAMLAHLETITPELKATFSRVFVSITPPTLERHQAHVEGLARDPFFDVTCAAPGSQVGDHFIVAYKRAAEQCHPQQQLHLCTLDRLAYALESEHREAFLRDVRAAGRQEKPILYQRSAAAWATHPRTYHAIEAMITRAGEVLFGRSLDYAWCHLAIRAGRLVEILRGVEGIGDLTFLGVMVLELQDEIVTWDVDWLAWEDPFILGQDPDELKRTRESDPADCAKRLAYAVPMVRALLARATRDR